MTAGTETIRRYALKAEEYESTMNTIIRVKAKDPEAQRLLERSIKWIRRIEERQEDLPVSLMDGCSPKPLRRAIERYLASLP